MKINVFVIIFLSFIFSLNGLKNYSFEVDQEQVCEKVHVEPLTFYNQDNLSNLEMFRYDDYRTILNFDLPSYGETGASSRMSGLEHEHIKTNVSIDSLNDIGIVTIDLQAVNSETSEEISNRIYAYPSINPINNKLDIQLDLYGNLVAGSEILNDDWSANARSIIPNIPSIPIIDLRLIVEIVLDLADMEDVNTFASMLIDIPVLSIDNPLPYFLYMVKVESAKSHYINNSGLEGDTMPIEGYIDNQGDLEHYKYGISDLLFANSNEGEGNDVSPTNIGANGCGVVAAYNMLYDSGANITFSALAALFELCGADLLFGYFGVNPVPDYYDTIIIPTATTLLLSVYATVLQPLLNLCLSLIEPLLYGLLGFTPADLLVPGFSITVVVVAVTSLRILINDAGRMIAELIAWYLDYMKSETEILRLFYGSYLHEYSIFDFAGFESHMSIRGQGIVCYWKSKNADGSADISQGAHYVYIYRNASLLNTSFETLNNGGNVDTCSTYNFEQLFGSQRNPGVPAQFIWGYVLSDTNDWGSDHEML